MWAPSFIGLRPLSCRLLEHTPSLAYVHPTPLSAMWATSFIGLRPPHSAVGYVGTLLHWLTSTPLRCRLIEQPPSLAYVHPTPLSAMWILSFIGLCTPPSAVGYVGNLLHWLTSTPPPLSAMWATSFIGLHPPHSAVGYVGTLLHWLTSTPLRCRLIEHTPSLAYVHPPPLSARWATSFIGLRPPHSTVGYVGTLLHWLTSTPLRCRLIEHTPSLAYVHPTPLSAMWATSFIGLCPPHSAVAMWAPSFIGLRPPHSVVGYVGTLLHWPMYTPLRCRLCGRPPSLAYVHPTPLSAN